MTTPELPPRREDRLGRRVHLYTPDILGRLEASALPRFKAAVNLLRASIYELRDTNGVATTNNNLKDHEIIYKDHEIIYPESTPTVPTLRSWDEMITKTPDRTPFLIAIEEAGQVVAVCEGRIYPFPYPNDLKETAIFIEQTGVEKKHRGKKLVDRLYSEVNTLAENNGVTLLVGAVNVQNGTSRKVVERQPRRHIAAPPLDDQGNPRDPDRFWPHPEGAYLPDEVNEDVDSNGNPINVVFEYYTQRLGPMPEA